MNRAIWSFCFIVNPILCFGQSTDSSTLDLLPLVSKFRADSNITNDSIHYFSFLVYKDSMPEIRFKVLFKYGKISKIDSVICSDNKGHGFPFTIKRNYTVFVFDLALGSNQTPVNYSYNKEQLCICQKPINTVKFGMHVNDSMNQLDKQKLRVYKNNKKAEVIDTNQVNKFTFLIPKKLSKDSIAKNTNRDSSNLPKSKFSLQIAATGRYNPIPYQSNGYPRQQWEYSYTLNAQILGIPIQQSQSFSNMLEGDIISLQNFNFSLDVNAIRENIKQNLSKKFEKEINEQYQDRMQKAKQLSKAIDSLAFEINDDFFDTYSKDSLLYSRLQNDSSDLTDEQKVKLNQLRNSIESRKKNIDKLKDLKLAYSKADPTQEIANKRKQFSGELEQSKSYGFGLAKKTKPNLTTQIATHIHSFEMGKINVNNSYLSAYNYPLFGISSSIDFNSSLRFDLSIGTQIQNTKLWNSFSNLNERIVGSGKLSKIVGNDKVVFVTYSSLKPYANGLLAYSELNYNTIGLGYKYGLSQKSKITFEIAHSFNDSSNRNNAEGTSTQSNRITPASLAYDVFFQHQNLAKRINFSSRVSLTGPDFLNPGNMNLRQGNLYWESNLGQSYKWQSFRWNLIGRYNQIGSNKDYLFSKLNTIVFSDGLRLPWGFQFNHSLVFFKSTTSFKNYANRNLENENIIQSISLLNRFLNKKKKVEFVPMLTLSKHQGYTQIANGAGMRRNVFQLMVDAKIGFLPYKTTLSMQFSNSKNLESQINQYSISSSISKRLKVMNLSFAYSYQYSQMGWSQEKINFRLDHSKKFIRSTLELFIMKRNTNVLAEPTTNLVGFGGQLTFLISIQ